MFWKYTVWRLGNKVTMNKKSKKVSPFVLGMAMCCYQVVQQPMAYAASLGSNNSSDINSLAPSVPVDAPVSAGAAGGCPLGALKATPKSGTLPSGSSSAASSSLGYQSESIAESGVASASKGSGTVKVAQLVPDENCCELGGTSDCELGGLPPAGGAAAGGGFPFAALAGLLPLAAIPFALGDGKNGNEPAPPVPEPSSTAGIVAGFGIFGLWFSRRYRAGKNPSA
jgi:hypothetical protein